MEDPKGRYTLRDIVGDKYERIFHMAVWIMIRKA
mgnify:CR=1 FL=1